MENKASEEVLKTIPDSEEELMSSSVESITVESITVEPIEPSPIEQPRETVDATVEAPRSAVDHASSQNAILEDHSLPKEQATNLESNETTTQQESIAEEEPESKPPSSPKTQTHFKPSFTATSNTLADLTAQKTALLASFASLPTIAPQLQQATLPSQTDAASDSSSPHTAPSDAAVLKIAKDLISEHIKLLHTYNEIKDIGQGLMGLIADQRGVRIVEVQDEFGIGVKD
ncbi:hypothetical protein K432DRAFT_325581 [Lepidopterella palustris CBS 459.81]|uniref:Swi5-domain-containing protein n=1 Tax=Lepidopterella palustris CBS 459.81 TaxID=1314670 RepID=A0A8E2JGG9_9PEZI|nr:hypothetical protein K432DRAFT_325581 [Lepidopterella palustris CBS 459.81]